MASGRFSVPMLQERVGENPNNLPVIQNNLTATSSTLSSDRHHRSTSPVTSQHKFSKHHFPLKPRSLYFSSNSHHRSPSSVTSHHKKSNKRSSQKPSGREHGQPLLNQYQNTSEESKSGGADLTEKDDFRKYIPLYQAALRGDWATADTIFTEDKGALTAKINEYEETALHVATGAGRPSKSIDFVTKLVIKMPPEALELRDQYKWTPLHLAAWAGNKEATKVLLKKRPSLLYIRECSKLSALDMAARNAKKDTLLYLLDVTQNDPFSKLFPDDDSAAHFLILVIASGYYDIALYLVEKYPNFATTQKKNGDCGLKALARKVSAFKSGSDHQWWQRIIYAQIPVKYLYDDLGELVMKE